MELEAGLDRFIFNMKEKDIAILYAQVYKDGKLLQEYNRLGQKTRLNVYSVSKSVTSIAVGIAIKEGYIKLDDKVAKFFPEYVGICPIINMISIENLLTMTCGLKNALFFGDDSERYVVKDWIDYFMKSEFSCNPGENFLYSNFNTYLLSCIIERVTKENLIDYLDHRFFSKIGIGNPDWLSCPKGHCIGANHLMLTIDEMAKIGHFLLNDGEWNGEQILPKSYLVEAVKNKISTNVPGYGYGYQFWLNPDGSYRADGKYGQYIIVVPKSKVVVVVQALSETGFFDELWEQVVSAVI